MPEPRGRIDLAEIGDIVILIVILAAGAFAVPGGAGGGSGARNFPVFGAVTGNFSFFRRLFGYFGVIFRCYLRVLSVISLFRRNREIIRAEQGIGPARAGNGSRTVAGVDGRDCFSRNRAQREAQHGMEQRQRGRDGRPGRERVKGSHGGTVAGDRDGVESRAGDRGARLQGARAP